MKLLMMLCVATLTGTFFLRRSANQGADKQQQALLQALYRKKEVLSCRPDLSSIDLSDSSNAIPILDGWGKYRMQVTVANKNADTYFQQGINMYYGFHIIEALASFERAIQIDPNFAMAYRGKALAYGPNINDLGYTASPEALSAIKKAGELSGDCSNIEQSLIKAMSVRYTADTTQTREKLNQLYAAAMKKTHDQFPDNADAAALYADALMIQHPWNLYDAHYHPKPWTPQIVNLLEQLVQRFPDNPGANHYYIHAVEGSQHPEKALPVANRLGNMMPGVAHLVHMPSHIYIRSGDYNKGIDANTNAINGFNNYAAKYQPSVNGAFLYLLHNAHMQAACAMMGGQYKKAVQYSDELKKNIDNPTLESDGYMGTYAQYVYSANIMTAIRFGKWEDILRMPDVEANHVYQKILLQFARGMAFARTNKLSEARAALQNIETLESNAQLADHPAAFNPAVAGVQLADKILRGVVAEESKDYTNAITYFKEAVAAEDNMLYNEPRDWLLPARQYLGNTLLLSGHVKEAKKIFREDLQINPANQWSLTGLLDALQQQHITNDAILIKSRLKASQAMADIKISRAVF